MGTKKGQRRKTARRAYKGKKIGSVTTGRQTGFRGYMNMMSSAKGAVKVFRMTGQKAYIRNPKRTATGWEINIFEKR